MRPLSFNCYTALQKRTRHDTFCLSFAVPSSQYISPLRSNRTSLLRSLLLDSLAYTHSRQLSPNCSPRSPAHLHMGDEPEDEVVAGLESRLQHLYASIEKAQLHAEVRHTAVGGRRRAAALPTRAVAAPQSDPPPSTPPPPPRSREERDALKVCAAALAGGNARRLSGEADAAARVWFCAERRCAAEERRCSEAQETARARREAAGCRYRAWLDSETYRRLVERAAALAIVVHTQLHPPPHHLFESLLDPRAARPVSPQSRARVLSQVIEQRTLSEKLKRLTA